MKAIRVREFGPPEVMRLEDLPDLKAGPGQIVVRIEAAGVNPVDSYVRTGTYARKPGLPYTPGSDGAGIIELLGDGVKGPGVGVRVYVAGTLTGTYAEQAVCEPRHVHPLPERASFGQGAGVGVPYATAYRALFQLAKAQPGEVVLVHGASGGVGIAAVQFARAAGLTVIGTGGTEKGRRLVLEQGAHHVLDHRRPGDLEKVPELTHGRGVDLIIEMLANANLGRDLKFLAPHGRVVVVGSRGLVEIDPRDAMSRSISIMGMVLFNAPENELAGIHAALAAGLDNGALRPVVGTTLPLGDAPMAHHQIMEQGAYGKIILVP